MLSAEQRTRIRQTVLASSNAPRMDNVNFSLSVGTAVPSSVRVVEVPETLIEIHPEWRGHMYFVVHDDIIIVDHDHRIIALVPMGSSSAQASSSSQVATAGAGGSLNLSREEILQLQVALNEKGFNIGEPDGALGPRTRQALIQFQQRQGFQARGQIDHETMGALGLSNVGGQQGRQGASQPSSTTGQGMQEPRGNQGAGAAQSGKQNGGQPATSGQGMPQQPANQGAGAGQSNTNGKSTAPAPQNRSSGSGGGAQRSNEQGR
jgi:peptidoglycan hydrolase-like protein with peptidoglycan-binding domain